MRLTSIGWLAVAFGLSGCLYLEGINETPVAGLDRENPEDIYIGQRVYYNAAATEDDAPEGLVYLWTSEARGGADTPPPEVCPNVYVTPERYCVVPRGKGTHRVTVLIKDALGAWSTVSAEFDVFNRDPSAALTINSVPKPNNHFIAGQEIWLFAGASSDPDDGDVLRYTWDVERPPASQTTDFVFETADDQRRWTSDPNEAVFARMVPDVDGTYRVRVTVFDEDSSDASELGSDTAEVVLEVDPDQPPCVTATEPVYGGGTLVFDRGETRRLEVTRVTDDRDPYPAGSAQFSWLIEETPGAGFLEIPGFSFPYLDLDGSNFLLGQRVRVRAIARDRIDRQSLIDACPVGDTVCSTGGSCFLWVTWDLEFR